MAAREDPSFATAIGAADVDIAALHANVDTSELLVALQQTLLTTGMYCKLRTHRYLCIFHFN